jgi:hypothetical protein
MALSELALVIVYLGYIKIPTAPVSAGVTHKESHGLVSTFGENEEEAYSYVGWRASIRKRNLVRWISLDRVQ